MRTPAPLGWTGLVFLTALLSGCFPSSCNRTESRALLPSDSTSRAIAEELPVDTLLVLGIIASTDEIELKYPRTVAFAPEGRVWVSDTEMQRLVAYDSEHVAVEVIETGDRSFPYIAGFHGDTLLVLLPQASEIVAYVGNLRVGGFSLPDDLPERGAFQYAAASEDRLYFKAIADNFEGYVIGLSSNGDVIERWNLTGAHWRFAGLLRVWGDSVLSLSGYRPVVHVMTNGESVDTLVLRGFDSPMLARSRRFVTGDLDVPPLLTASAASAGDYLFVLNMRPGWLRVDVYNHEGRLQYILTQPWPEFNQNYYPTDIGVQRRRDGSFELAVTVIEPEPRIERYLWWPRGDASNSE